jgi:hypothetical protein
MAQDITNVVTAYTSSRLFTFAASNPAPSVSAVGKNGVGGPGGAFGTPLVVTVSYTFTGLLLGPLVRPFTGPIILSSTATMNNE